MRFSAFHSSKKSTLLDFGEPNGEPRRADGCERLRTRANGKSSVRAQFRTPANPCERPKPTPQASGSTLADPCERRRTHANAIYLPCSYRVRISAPPSVRDEGELPLYSIQVSQTARLPHSGPIGSLRSESGAGCKTAFQRPNHETDGSGPHPRTWMPYRTTRPSRPRRSINWAV